jgi:hypothetical protein
LEEEKNISEDKIPSDLPQTTLPYGKMYTEDMGVHVKTVLQSRKNHRLELSEKVERGLNVEDLIQENYALLRTSEGKFIKLDDGTGEGFDRVEIGDGQGNQIIIQTGEDEVSGPMAITIKCEGNINIESKSGNISVACDSVDSELNLETQGRLSLMSPDIFIGGNTTV